MPPLTNNTTVVYNPRSSSNHSRYFREKRFQYHRRKSQWWRNPCIIFVVSFLALASLRLRVPERSRRAANRLREQLAVHRRERTENNFSKMDFKASNKNSTTDSSTNAKVHYSIVEKGKDEKGRSFQRYQAMWEQIPVSVQKWVELMMEDDDANDAIDSLNNEIQSAPYDAVFFETPPVEARAMGSQPVEFILMDAPELHAAASGRPDVNSFAQHWSSNTSADAVAFSNLGGDAKLIAPIPSAAIEDKSYSHLAVFARMASKAQIAAVWRLTANEYLNRVQSQQPQPVWLSTSGMGVNWLHIRLDSVPKYYTYTPFKKNVRENSNK